MTQQIEPDPGKIMGVLKGMLNKRQAWDEQPEWGCLYRGEGPIEVRPISVQGKVWHKAGHPKFALRTFCEVFQRRDAQSRNMARALRANVPSNLVGMYLRTEGYAAPKNRALEMYQRREAGRSVPQFAAMQGARELRSVVAVDTIGRAYVAVQHRDDMVLDGGWDHGDAVEGEKVDGDVPAVLAELLRLFMHEPSTP